MLHSSPGFKGNHIFRQPKKQKWTPGPQKATHCAKPLAARLDAPALNAAIGACAEGQAGRRSERATARGLGFFGWGERRRRHNFFCWFPFCARKNMPKRCSLSVSLGEAKGLNSQGLESLASELKFFLLGGSFLDLSVVSKRRKARHEGPFFGTRLWVCPKKQVWPLKSGSCLKSSHPAPRVPGSSLFGKTQTRYFLRCQRLVSQWHHRIRVISRSRETWQTKDLGLSLANSPGGNLFRFNKVQVRFSQSNRFSQMVVETEESIFSDGG